MILRGLVRVLIFIWVVMIALVGAAMGVGYLLPGGHELAYTKSMDANHLTVFLRDVNRNIERQLTDQYSDSWSPSWSFDGKQIAYISSSKSSTSTNLYIADANGQNKRILVSGFPRQTSLNWSADGQWILFFYPSIDVLLGTSFVNIETGEITSIDRHVEQPMWSADGQMLLDFVNDSNGNSHYYEMPMKCLEKPKTCEFSKMDILHNQLIFFKPALSPDGHAIVFAENLQGDTRIVLARLRCADLIEECVESYSIIGNTPLIDSVPIWSADNKQIAFVSGHSQIYIVDIETGHSYSIPAPHIASISIDWSPDKHFFTYLYEQIGVHDIYLLNAVTGKLDFFQTPYNVDLFYNYVSPKWRPLPR